MDHPDHVALLRDGVPESPPDRGPVWADLGAGTGAFTLALAELLGPDATIVAVDRDERALDEARRRVQEAFPSVGVEPLAGDFTGPLAMPPLDGIVMANSLHFVREQLPVVRLVASYLRPHGRIVIVEYDTDSGNPWVPHPFSYARWERLAAGAGLVGTRRIGRVPSRFLGAIYSAVSERPDTEGRGTMARGFRQPSAGTSLSSSVLPSLSLNQAAL